MASERQHCHSVFWKCVFFNNAFFNAMVSRFIFRIVFCLQESKNCGLILNSLRQVTRLMELKGEKNLNSKRIGMCFVLLADCVW